MSYHWIIQMLACTLLAIPMSAAKAPPATAVSELHVLTLNLRSRLDSPDLREPAIAAYLSRTQPDVVLLQEVGNVKGPELTQAHRLARTSDYEIAACFNKRTNRGLAVLSKYPVVDVVVQDLPRRKRPALGVVINVNGRLVSFVNVHLTPQLSAVKQRQLELDATLKLMQSLPGPSFLGGDFNFGDSAEENAHLADLVDTFRIAQPEAPGHTWDLDNPLARKNSFPKEPSRRLDRILISDSRTRVTAAEVVLDEQVVAGIFPSDHYGVYTRVELFPVPLEVPQSP
ncbi:MAG: endonuclease/exonuclease/phosphatase family metal-dependent hydrolase [Myxococcota bacterium]|jgi:endonuclease/exonuclease/phosphatase family metal-dependent hydrolase